MLLREELDFITTDQRWSPLSSGEEVQQEAAGKLEAAWLDLTGADPPWGDPDDVTLAEGTVRQTSVTKYERSRVARSLCIEHYGVSCTVCGFNFEEVYGAVGKGYIEVHHLTAISQTKAAHDINPIRDMRPVCPNCHAMIHQRKPPYALEEIEELIRSKV
jgi:5-methylcytosine-specific restriction protein A